mmetsp:Transcript_3460/g.10007  ORF Transcript_3460/g.10007 Transcript_3460/m.10007 type:complete len:232 (+) Transcript_3460:628-1323(+)
MSSSSSCPSGARKYFSAPASAKYDAFLLLPSFLLTPSFLLPLSFLISGSFLAASSFLAAACWALAIFAASRGSNFSMPPKMSSSASLALTFGTTFCAIAKAASLPPMPAAFSFLRCFRCSSTFCKVSRTRLTVSGRIGAALLELSTLGASSLLAKIVRGMSLDSVVPSRSNSYSIRPGKKVLGAPRMRCPKANALPMFCILFLKPRWCGCKVSTTEKYILRPSGVWKAFFF